MLSLPDDKTELEKIKLKEEINKIEIERLELSKGKIRFQIGSIAVPLFVAGVTGLLLYFTGILDTREKLNELNKLQNEQEENRFKVSKDELMRADSFLKIRNDSLIAVNHAISVENDSLARNSRINQQLNVVYQKLIKSGLSKDQQVNILIRRNDSLQRQIYHLNRELDDNNEKSSFLKSNFGQLLSINKMLSDSLTKQHDKFLYDMRNSVRYWDMRNEEQVGQITQLKDENKIIKDSLARINKRLGN